MKFTRGLARETGALLMKHLGGTLRISYKGWNNIVTEVDHRAQALIIRRIQEKYPDHVVVAEEADNPMAKGRDERYVWYVDPLDGTTNYAHTFPAFCVSIGLAVRGVRRIGVVYDPSRDELFSASKGGGAWLNGRRLQVSRRRRLQECLLATGFTYDPNWAKRNLAHFANFLTACQAVRRPGSAALDLCYTACGRLDGFWELKLNPWDVAAGSLIVEEAGGRVTDFRGRPYDIYGLETLASNGLIHSAMLRILRRGLKRRS